MKAKRREAILGAMRAGNPITIDKKGALRLYRLVGVPRLKAEEVSELHTEGWIEHEGQAFRLREEW